MNTLDFIQELLDDALRAQAILGKTVKRQGHELEHVKSDYNKLHRLSTELNALYDDIPDWIKQLSIWWRKKRESINIRFRDRKS